MRLLVINASRDPDLERVRRRFPGQVLQRPTIAGLPLPPGGKRTLTVDHLTPGVVDHLDHLVAIGNVRVVELGGKAAVDFDKLRARLGYPVLAATAPIEPPAPPVEPEPAVPTGGEEVQAVSTLTQELEALAVEHGLITKEEQDARRADATVEDILGAAPPVDQAEGQQPGAGEAFELPQDIDALLRGSKNKKLAAVLAIFGKSVAGKNKLTLIDEAGDCLVGDPDPVLANRAISVLRGESTGTDSPDQQEE